MSKNLERCPSGLRSWSWKPVIRQRTVGSNPTLSAKGKHLQVSASALLAVVLETRRCFLCICKSASFALYCICRAFGTLAGGRKRLYCWSQMSCFFLLLLFYGDRWYNNADTVLVVSARELEAATPRDSSCTVSGAVDKELEARSKATEVIRCTYCLQVLFYTSFLHLFLQIRI